MTSQTVEEINAQTEASLDSRTAETNKPATKRTPKPKPAPKAEVKPEPKTCKAMTPSERAAKPVTPTIAAYVAWLNKNVFGGKMVTYPISVPANIGYMSGALKHFFDGIYYPCLEATRRRPYGLYVHGGMDTGGAVRAEEAIATGLQWRAVRPPVCVTGTPGRPDLEAC
jgi:hypothetical protein